MSISLFPHNAEAYDAVLSMLSEHGKACVVHPTGTGKSFIAFKYCEDHPEQSVLWLSPSEYIFKTQCENLSATGASLPENIQFCTYAKLSIMDDAEMDELRPYAIIEDEFHRCGAQKWEQGLERLRRRYPKALRIGLSATSVRYLDSQRDMKAEIYDNCVASEMTLGEAIVRGILNAPTYVLSVFKYEQDFKRLQYRARHAKSRAVRDQAERYLEALRRTLENADGLDVIFEKYMKDRHGKYLVFTANLEHMNEMVGKVPEWFGKIDPEPHVYAVSADDPASKKTFQAFKADDSAHLKLLFSVDLLNEGVHVEDVSGVILFRPTVSPIIYKQQIGRALSASKSKDPIIFDIVNNIDNLYSIGSIQQEMQTAINYYHFFGDGSEIVTERFQVIDELRDARKLFEQLNDTLTASWDIIYGYAEAYYSEHGDLEVPRKYRTPEGYSLGSWVQQQRRVYAGEIYGVLGEDRIRKLERIGMRWGSYLDLSWERYYAAARRYYEVHGDLRVNVRDVTADGLKLGTWIANLRTYKKSGIRTAYLTEKRIMALEQIGMLWDVPDYLWEENFTAAMDYFREHGNLDIPCGYCAPNGLRIGTWVHKLRGIRKGRIAGTALTEEQIQRLDSIGMLWDTKFERAWQRGMEEAQIYRETHGDFNVPTSYVSPSGYRLGAWIADRREKRKENHTPEQQAELDALGMIWEKPDSWETRYLLAKAYYEAHSDLNMPGNYKPDGIWLAKWLNEQRQIYIGNRPGKLLTEEQIQKLESIGMVWENRNHQQWSSAWDSQYRTAKQFYEEHGNLYVPRDCVGADGKNLNRWLACQRKRWTDGKLPEDQVKLLNEIGMVWEFDDSWEIGFAHAEQYYQENGNLNVKHGYVCPADGYRLGSWITNQRNNHNNPSKYHSMRLEQVRRLENIGMAWKPSEEQWMEGYRHAVEYLTALNGQSWKTNYVSPSDGFQTGAWMRGQLRAWNSGTMKPERKERFLHLGLVRAENQRTAKQHRSSNQRSEIQSGYAG